MRQKIIFILEQDEDGYPPVAAEGVWARHLGESRYELDNVPFFACQATLGDVVRAQQEEGECRYRETLRESKNSLIRIVCYRGVDPTPIRARMHAVGCATEYDATHGLIAVSVPKQVRLAAVYEAMEPDLSEERLDYEEAILRQ